MLTIAIPPKMQKRDIALRADRSRTYMPGVKVPCLTVKRQP